MATDNKAVPNKDDPKKNPEPNRAGTDINKNVADVQERKEEDAQKEQEQKEADAYKARMDYGVKLHEAEEPLLLNSEEDWAVANALVADGFAQVRAEQTGTEVKNWLELNDEGLRAIQAYNTKTD